MVSSSWRRTLGRVRTPMGRRILLRNGQVRAWPLFRRLAATYRKTLARRPRIVAVVGSLGKTTTVRAVVAALAVPAPRRTGANAFTSVALAVLRVRPWQTHGVIEAGIAAVGQMRPYAEMIRPDITVVTSIASEHNRSLKDLSVTRTEKAKMVRALEPSGLAVLNGDDPNVAWMRGTTRARVVTFGFDEGNDVRATEANLDWPDGTRFLLHANGTTRSVRVRLIGRTSLYPALAAIAVGLAEGVALETILKRLENLPPTPGRLAPVRLASGAILLRDDFKSPLESIDAALDVLDEIPARRKIVVLGDVSEPPGSMGPIYHRLGDRIAVVATQAIFLGSNGRRYATGANRAGMRSDAVRKAGRSPREATESLPSDLGEGDVVLIKGRGNQRLERIALALMGRDVRCDIDSCPAPPSLRCDACQMLERGWRGRPVVT